MHADSTKQVVSAIERLQTKGNQNAEESSDARPKKKVRIVDDKNAADDEEEEAEMTTEEPATDRRTSPRKAPSALSSGSSGALRGVLIRDFDLHGKAGIADFNKLASYFDIKLSKSRISSNEV